MRTIGTWIADVLADPDKEEVRLRVRGQVREMCEQYPAPTTET